MPWDYKSNFEKRVGKGLSSKKMEFTYEKESFEYTDKLRKNRTSCADCGSTNVVSTRSYTPDFFLDNGTIIEAKGKWTADGRRIAKNFPEVKLLFMRDNRLSKHSRTHYTDWCAQNDIDCHISYKGEVPARWLR